MQSPQGITLDYRVLLDFTPQLVLTSPYGTGTDYSKCCDRGVRWTGHSTLHVLKEADRRPASHAPWLHEPSQTSSENSDQGCDWL